MGFFDFFKFKPVTNADRFDRRTYGQLRGKSPKLAELEQKGTEKLPSFPHLMGDVFAGLYKYQPRLLDEVPAEVSPNKIIMEKIMQHQEFIGLREHTKLDDLASALGLLHMGEKLDEFLDQELPKEDINNWGQQQQKAQQLRDKANFLQDSLQYARGDKKEQLKKQITQTKRQATMAENKAKKVAKNVATAIENTLNKSDNQSLIGQIILDTQNGIKEDINTIESFMSGLGYGTQPGEKINMDPATALNLREIIKNNQKLKNISILAGRMKQIAQKKQKSKTKNTNERTEISLGNDTARLLPQEVSLLTSEETSHDFYKRYTEKKLLQYSPEGKNKLGKGPIVICLDTSGSMENKDAEAKAIMLALLSIAKKQKRAFAVVNFSSAQQHKVWQFPNAKNVKVDTTIEMAQFFWNGGTDFQKPLEQACKIIESNKFNKADIVFITDGDSKINSKWLEKFQTLKKNKKFQVISVKIGKKGSDTLKQFSDKVISANSLFDKEVTDSVLSI